jgi:hypothetical protein
MLGVGAMRMRRRMAWRAVAPSNRKASGHEVSQAPPRRSERDFRFERRTGCGGHGRVKFPRVECNSLKAMLFWAIYDPYFSMGFFCSENKSQIILRIRGFKLLI